MLKKPRAALKKCIDFCIDFSPKINEKSSPKVRKTLFARKNDKKSLPDAPFGAKGRFWVDFWVPVGTLKLVKICGPFWEKGSWEPSGSHFGRFNHFFSILAPLLVHSGSILDPPGSIFSWFLQFFLFFGSVVFIAVSFFDHDFHVIFSSLRPLFHSKTARKRHVKTTIQQGSMTTRQQDSRTATQQPNNPTTNNPTTQQPTNHLMRPGGMREAIK